MINKFKNDKGFTLIELMIVVAIIGVLAAIAIPQYTNFRYKAKTAEAKSNLGAIRLGQEAYFTEHEAYVVCAATPDAVAGSFPGKNAIPWADADGNFVKIGFSAKGQVYYQYAVALPAAGGFSASALGNLDGDNETATFSITDNGVWTIPTDRF